MYIDLVEFGITHFGQEIEQLPGSNISGLTMGSKEKLEKIIEVLNWCDEKNIRYMFGWRMVKTDNDVGSYFYRLCPSISMLAEKDAMLIRLSWPDLDIHISDYKEEE